VYEDTPNTHHGFSISEISQNQLKKDEDLVHLCKPSTDKNPMDTLMMQASHDKNNQSIRLYLSKK
jgi:hypothetical protein